MKATIITAAALTLGLSAITAPAAQASERSEREATAYAVMHMPSTKAIPKALGTYRTNFFSASSNGERIYLCDLEQKSATVKGGKYTFSASYRSVKRDGPGYVTINVWQYGNATNAIKGFNAIKKAAKQCRGSNTQTFTEDGGSTSTYSHNLSNGTVPSVSVVGVPSIFINSDYAYTSSEPVGNSKSDNYTVYTLVGDVVIGTTYGTSASSSLSAAERKAANQLAFNAVGAWVG